MTECDFCGFELEEDEELEPLYIGSLPRPRPHIIQETGPRGGSRTSRAKAKYRLLRKALRDFPEVQLKESDRVFEPEFKPTVSENPTRGFTESEVDKLAVSIKIEPKERPVSPDAEVCHICHDFFKRMGE
jgi:hypothetical protein